MPLDFSWHFTPKDKFMPDDTPEGLARKAFIRCCATIASTIVLFLESVYLFKEEYRFIWRAPINVIKCTYVLSRYLILLFQIANSVVVTTHHMYTVPVSDIACFYWTCAQTCATISSLFLEVVLMVRVYALHTKSLKIGVMLCCSLTVEMAVYITTSVMAIRGMQVDDACVSTTTPKGVFGFAAASIGQQLLIWGLTFRRWSFLQTMNDAGQKISQVMVRDGTWVLIGVCAVVSITVPYSVYIDQVTHVLFSINEVYLAQDYDTAVFSFYSNTQGVS
ncbi:hypothetical protein AMATHDRAFT_49691 [Amanita thiersii Skay4041]|uniref:DUF6533 domain-containing protein n=1 Tax=Amanita thiersii Skay4041 TaxID=703135 RepID=A0A2A9NB44_9AGAR|nr:hypothetical protein AMATHDRAFT_49691 [Amanita thiersii Skay4041]